MSLLSSWRLLSVHCRSVCRGSSLRSLTSDSAAVGDNDDFSGQSEKSAAVTSSQQQRHRLRCFNDEHDRQLKRNQRTIDKIEVLYYGPDGQPTSLYMNRHLSTPLDVAMHLSEDLTRESVLAVVNDNAWDMHRPLTGNCTMRFLHFRSPSSRDEAMSLKTCNTALWRSGSLLLGSVFEAAFKDAYQVKLVSFPPPYLPSGSFVYDCQVLDSAGQFLAWSAGKAELRALSVAAERLLSAGHPFHRLEVPAAVAKEMFKHNEFKLAAVDKILESKQEKLLSVYKVGDFVDISGGPMIANAGLIGRFLFTAVHQVESKDYGPLLRVQGLAIPRSFLTHFSSIEVLAKRAAVLNSSFLPSKPTASPLSGAKA